MNSRLILRALLLLSFATLPAHAELQKVKLTPAGSGSETLFRERSPEQTGVNFVNVIDEEHPMNRLYISGFACGGTSLGDLDNDGLLDVILTTGPRQNRIFRQVGNWKFEEVVWDESSADVWSTGAAVLDIDGDGDLDIYVCNYDVANRLYINETVPGGEITFREAAEEWGLDIADASLTPSFADYDLDGDLDIFLLTSEFKRDKGRPIDLPIDGIDTDSPRLKPGFDKYYTLVEEGPGQYIYYNIGRENLLLQNQSSSGEKKFINVSEQAGISGRTFGLSCTWYDHDADGDMDLYVCNDFDDPDQLWLNNGDGTFTDVIKLAAPYTCWFAMGSDAADLNNDGRFDLVIADMGMTTHYKAKTTMGDMSPNKEFLDTAIPRQAMRNTCMINTGTGRFIEAAYMAGLANTDWTWAVKCSDFDCDGMVDVFFANGMARVFKDSDNVMPLSFMFGNTEFDFLKSADKQMEENMVFRNLGDLKFENTSKAWGLDHSSMSYSAATGDLDNDGDLDLIVANLDEPVSFYENTTSAATSRITVKLRGTKGNSHGVGAVVRLMAGGKTQVKALSPMTGFVSCNESALQFGLGAAKSVEWLEVEWPGGGTQRFTDLEIGHAYTITEPGGAVQKRARPKPDPHFARVQMFPGAGHRELPFDDYAEQPLLPWKQSQMGPGMAWADLDFDGDDDFFLAQGTGSAGYVYYQQADKTFQVTSTGPFEAESQSEDMAPLFFDADKDGRLDLLITSGSVEQTVGDAAYADRLYLGIEGKTGFAPAYKLPGDPMSSSVAAAADFDRDGDLDLFIGGRVVPGRWPTSPPSRLYLNESVPGSPKFVLAGDLAPDIANCERATSALWSDIDNDGWIDLLVTSEYGLVRIFHNMKGKLVDVTESTSLAKRTGVWNGIAGRDIDGDGDIDYALSNFGINTTYKASMEKPELLHYGDLDGTGEFRVVEAKFEGDVRLPRRGMSCSSQAMPSLVAKLKTYKAFASANLAEIYTPQRLEESGSIEITTLESSVLMNESTPGSIQFKLVKLPRMAQLAPAFGAVMSDLDGDQKTDLVLAQNFFSPQREVGRMSGSAGAAFLKGTGDPERPFVVVEAAESGIIISGDTKGLALNELNGDGIPDLSFSANSGPVYTFLNKNKPGRTFLRVHLKGRPGNLGAVGSRITVTSKKGVTQTAEIASGGSYLSQSSNIAFFGMGNGDLASEVTVRWPDGTSAKAKKVKPGLLEFTW